MDQLKIVNIPLLHLSVTYATLQTLVLMVWLLSEPECGEPWSKGARIRAGGTLA